MPPIGPLRRKELIHFLRRLGFDGPYSGAKHQFMIRGTVRLRLPNPHQADIGRGLLLRILKEAGISKEEWERLR